MKIRVIVNPSAAAGAAGKKIPALRRLFEARGVDALVQTTAHPGEATQLALDAAREGVDVLGVMGGDGTLSEVAQACLLSGNTGAAFGPSLALMPAGTGGDFKRNLDLADGLQAAVERMLGNSRQLIDMGVVSEHGHGTAKARAFVNVASIGISAMVCNLANRGSKWLGGRLTFLGAALRATARYENVPIRVRVDGAVVYEGPTYVVAIANGRSFGGGMQIAPAARMDDGLFEVVILGDYSKLGAVSLARAIYAGTHLGRSRTIVTQGTVVEVEALPTEAPSKALIEADGEVPDLRLPLRAVLRPRAVSVCT